MLSKRSSARLGVRLDGLAPERRSGYPSKKGDSGLALLAAVDDLFFAARIRETARQVAVPVDVVPTAKFESAVGRLQNANERTAVLVDLNSAQAPDLIRRLKTGPDPNRFFVVGFVSHVASDLISAAREAGCDQVMARSAFTKQLPDLLRQLVAQP